MEVISQKNLNKLIEMGFEVCSQADGYMRLFSGNHNLGIRLYCSEQRDDFDGVYMDITDIDGADMKHCKGRNVISNITRWIEMMEK